MKVSELIAGLQRMQEAYGDLPVTITTHDPELPMLLVTADEVHLGYDQYEKGGEINIRSFPY